MGVPAFFRWLSRKYPSIVVPCKEERAKLVDGVKVPIDISGPNPNQFEFDNLYLDMNGIIHPCCHPENKAAPSNEDEMMEAIFEYIDRLVAIVRPRKVLYMAIDGVAPRAKMNQQRSRRFRASKESKENREEIAKLKDEMRQKGLEVPADKPAVEHFDSNCITPGTEFMYRLAECLRYYIHMKLNSDPGWSQIMVILSDANVPGEGEHKIMNYIRRQRAQPHHDPNTSHCLCGADADLIMLGLATHEPNFTIIREEFKPHQDRPCEICGQLGHRMADCTGMARVKQGEFDELQKHVPSEQDFIFLRLNVLREYLSKELSMANLPFKQDIERAIDDWVLMCFFVGNDFLPHLPSLEIREGAIDRLIGLYKKIVFKSGGYLTDSGHVHLDRVQFILTELGGMEDEIFRKRRDQDQEFKMRNERQKRQRRSLGNEGPAWIPAGEFSPVPLGQNLTPNAINSDLIRSERQQNHLKATQSNRDAASSLRQSLQSGATRQSTGGIKRKHDEDNNDEPADDVRLWEEGWKERYYMNKFGIDSNEQNFRYKVANEYVLGICWVLKYYYQGCASWNWYFPYHYAPFASDFVDIGSLDIVFPSDTHPFKPLEQLMSVFPAASKQFLPPTWQELMYESESQIIDFYPTDFKVDLNGKKYAWQGVALLPFVDEVRLLKTLEAVYPDLTEYEQARNSLGDDRLFLHKSHKSFEFLCCLYENGVDETKISLNPALIHGIGGLVWCDDKAVLPGDLVVSPLENLDDCPLNAAICVKFLDPQFKMGFVFPAKMLPNAKLPDPVLKPRDYERSNPNQPSRTQTGFTRDSGYSNFNNASVANRMLRGSLNPAMGTQSNYRPPYQQHQSSYHSPRGMPGFNHSPYRHQHQGYERYPQPPQNRSYPQGGYNDSRRERDGGHAHFPRPPSRPNWRY